MQMQHVYIQPEKVKKALCKKAKVECFKKVTVWNSKLSNKEDISGYF